MEIKNFSALQNISFSIYEADSPQQQYEKLVAAVKKSLKKQPENIENIIQEINNLGIQTVHIKTIYPVSDFHCYLFSLLKVCSKNNHLGTGDIQRLEPTVIDIDNGQKQGYSLQKFSFPKRTHNRLWKLKNNSFAYQRIYDFYTIIATIYIDSILEKFVFSQQEFCKYLVVKKFTNTEHFPIKINIPINKNFRDDFIAIAQKNWDDNYIAIENKAVDKYQTVFYLTKFCPLAKNIIIPELINRLKSVKIKVALEKYQNSRYARTFETKKYISSKVIEIMKNNIFLEYYGYVELDNDINLEQFALWEKNFIALQKIFPIPKAKDHSFRIKKLGKYVSEGLYFPQKKAIVIDIKHPQSFFHETGHFIDYFFGKNDKTLSEDIFFKNIIDLYKEIVGKNIARLPAYNKVKKKWFGTSKFNQDYYCQNTEIFARSLEIYFSQQKTPNMLVEKNLDNNVLYPQNETYIKILKNYVENTLLPIILK